MMCRTYKERSLKTRKEGEEKAHRRSLLIYLNLALIMEIMLLKTENKTVHSSQTLTFGWETRAVLLADR